MFRPRGFPPPRRLAPPTTSKRIAAWCRPWGSPGFRAPPPTGQPTAPRVLSGAHTLQSVSLPRQPCPRHREPLPPRRSPRTRAATSGPCSAGESVAPHRPLPTCRARCSPGLPSPGACRRPTPRHRGDAAPAGPKLPLRRLRCRPTRARPARRPRRHPPRSWLAPSRSPTAETSVRPARVAPRTPSGGCPLAARRRGAPRRRLGHAPEGLRAERCHEVHPPPRPTCLACPEGLASPGSCALPKPSRRPRRPGLGTVAPRRVGCPLRRRGAGRVRSEARSPGAEAPSSLTHAAVEARFRSSRSRPDRRGGRGSQEPAPESVGYVKEQSGDRPARYRRLASTRHGASGQRACQSHATVGACFLRRQWANTCSPMRSETPLPGRSIRSRSRG